MLLSSILSLVFIYMYVATQPETVKDDWNTNSYREVLGQLITNQTLLCRYIQRCDVASNVARPPARDTNGYICCKPCSCNESCVENRTCCPDFVVSDNKTFIEYLTANAIFSTRQSDLKFNLTDTDEETSCVKVKYGNFKNNGGYKMISSCISYGVKSSAEGLMCTATRAPNVDTIFSDLVPVTSLDSGLTYKNIHCLMCREEKSVTLLQWDVWLICYLFANFPDSWPTDPAQIAVGVLRNELRCHLLLQLEVNNSKLIGDNLHICSIDVIDTCPEEYTNKHFVKACQDYSWPIETTDLQQNSFVYNNLACILCNNATFDEKCLEDFYHGEKVELQLNVFGRDLYSRAPEDESKVINELFPDRYGEVRCDRGYIYDETQRICREVYCPSHFFLANGTCYPTFQRISGLTLRSIMEVKVTQLRAEDLATFSAYLIQESESFLLKWIPRDTFNLSLWGNTNLLDLFYLIINMKCELIEQNYIDLLAFIWSTFHNLVLKLITEFRKVTITMSIAGRHLSMSQICLSDIRKPMVNLGLLKSNTNGTSMELLKKLASLIVVELSFCYSVRLSENEYKRFDFYMQLPSNLTISRVGFRGDSLDTKRRFVCANSVVQGSKAFYTFPDVTKKEKVKFLSKINSATQESSKNPENKTLLKSLVALTSTCGIIVVVLCVRLTCKKITNQRLLRVE